MAKRNRGRKLKHHAEEPQLGDPTMRQLALDFTPEQAMDAFFMIGELHEKIASLEAVAKTARDESKPLKKQLSVLLRQAADKKRSVSVEVYEQVDLECHVVRTFRKDTREEIGFRQMTPEEIKSGVVLNPAQAAEALAHVASAAGETPEEEDEPESNLAAFTPVERAGMAASV